jgi:hypothetical protein
MGRTCLILADELAEADHIGREDGGEAARSHSGRPALRSASSYREMSSAR